MRGQSVALQETEKFHVRVAAPELAFLRAASNDDFGAGQLERKECLEFLFNRNPPNGNEDRPRKRKRNGTIRPEQVCVHAAGPHSKIGESAVGARARERVGRGGGGGRGKTEPPQRRVNPTFRYWGATRNVFGEPRRVAGGEGPALSSAARPHHMADASFGGDMNRIRIDAFDAASDFAQTRQGQA